MTFVFRPGLETLAPYRQGAPPIHSASGEPPLKLSSNETPYPPPQQVLHDVLKAADNFTRYPDAAGTELVARVAERHQVRANQISIGAGSVEVIAQLIHALTAPNDEVIYPWRSFEAYPSLIISAGAHPVPIALTDQARHDLASMIAAISDRTRLILICSPNNPTGTVISDAEIRNFLAQVPSHVVVAIDEAYAEFVDDPNALNGIDLMREHDNVVVLRTFSKAFGLAGLRVGYGLGASPIIEALRKVALPFGVSEIAQTAAIRSLADAPLALTLDRAARVVEERRRVETELQEHAVPCIPSQGNFVWLPTEGKTTAVAAAFEARGIAVRVFPGEGVRVTLATRGDNDRVIEAASLVFRNDIALEKD